MHKRKNNIEIIGLPGSGKSTIANLVKENSRFCVVQLNTKFEKASFLGVFIFLKPIYFLKYIKLIQGQPLLIRSYVRHLFFISCAKEAKAFFYSLFSKKIFLIDEGLCQRLLSIFEGKIETLILRKHLSSLPTWKKKFLVVEGTGFDRFSTAEDSMFSPRFKMGEVYLEAWKKDLEFNFYQVVDILSKNKSCIFIDNSQRSRLPKGVIIQNILNLK